MFLSSQSEATSVHHFSQSVPLASPMDHLHLLLSAALFSPPQLNNSSRCPQFYLHSILFLVNTFGISLAFSYRCNVSSPHLVTPHCDLQLNKIAESWCSGFTGEVEGLGQRETAEHKDYCVCATNCASTPS